MNQKLAHHASDPQDNIQMDFAAFIFGADLGHRRRQSSGRSNLDNTDCCSSRDQSIHPHLRCSLSFHGRLLLYSVYARINGFCWGEAPLGGRGALHPLHRSPTHLLSHRRLCGPAVFQPCFRRYDNLFVYECHHGNHCHYHCYCVWLDAASATKRSSSRE
jgi:hypothetical protein